MSAATRPRQTSPRPSSKSCKTILIRRKRADRKLVMGNRFLNLGVITYPYSVACDHIFI